MSNVTIRPMAIEDYDEVRALWETSPGVGLSPSDSGEDVELYLRAHPGLSKVAVRGGRVVGAVLCGHDCRRGYLTHLAVLEDLRRTGIATALVDACIDGLRQRGIDKCHVLVFHDNDAALAFYRSSGWVERGELTILSRFTADDKQQ